MPVAPEHKKAILIWRLRQDLFALKALCLKFYRNGFSKGELSEFLMEMVQHYQDVRKHLQS